MEKYAKNVYCSAGWGEVKEIDGRVEKLIN